MISGSGSIYFFLSNFSYRVYHLLVGLSIQSWSRDNRIDIQVAHSGTPWSIVFEAEVSIEEWCDFPVLLVQAWLFRKGHLSPSWHRGDGRSLWGNNGKHQATIGWIMCLNYWINMDKIIYKKNNSTTGWIMTVHLDCLIFVSCFFYVFLVGKQMEEFEQRISRCHHL
jgi:hypothetical protein